MDKIKFTKHMKLWLEEFAKSKYPEYDIEILIPNSTLDLLQNINLKKVVNIGLMKFNPDILGILIHKKSKKIELIFLNRETKKFGLKELGEMLCYCRIAQPKLALMVSLHGLSPAVDRLINHLKNNQIITYDDNQIKIFRWDEDLDKIDEYSITPVESKLFFN